MGIVTNLSSFGGKLTRWLGWRQSLVTAASQPRLGSVGKKSTIHANAHIEGYTEQVHVGRGVLIERDTTIRCDDPNVVVRIGDGSVLAPYAFLSTHKGSIEIGRRCSVNAYSVLYGLGGLKIGDRVRIAAHVVIVPANHIFDDPYAPIAEQGSSKKGILIEDDVWIGAGARILDGCVIGKGSVIGAGTVLTKSVGPYSVVVGVPGRVVGTRGAPREARGNE